jgi:threonylcarbamoyladenosine tRNA methylthiotransferase MtaB
MRRPYSASDYRDLTTRIRRDLPDAAIGSDIIVGFPGETDRDFADLCALLDELPLTHLHVFPYSDRPGTAASRMHPKVDGNVIRERGRAVRAAGARMAALFRQSQTGRRRRALTVDDGRSCVTDNYLKVALPERHARNEWVSVCV